MAENKIGPWFIQIRYKSKYSIHTFRHSTVEAYAAPVGGEWTFNNTSGGADTTVATGVGAFMDLWKVLYPNTWAAIDYILLEQQEGQARATPRAFGNLTQVGTLVSTFLTDRATQLQYNLADEENLPVKIPMMDFPIGSFTPNYNPSGNFDTLRDYLLDPNSWLIGRNGFVPVRFISLTATINNRLEAKYNRTLIA